MLKKNLKTKWLSKSVSMLCVLAMLLSSFTVVMAEAVTIPMVNRSTWCYASVDSALTQNLVYTGSPLNGNADNAAHELVILGTTGAGNVELVTGATAYYPDQVSYMADMSKYLDITESTRSEASMTVIVAQAIYNGQAKFVPALIGKKVFANGVQNVFIPMTNTDNWIGHSEGKNKWWNFSFNEGVSITYTLDKFDNYAIVDGAYLTEDEKTNSLGVYDKWGENFITSTGKTATWYKVAVDWTKIHPGVAMVAPTGNISNNSDNDVWCAALSKGSFSSAVKECTDVIAPSVPEAETIDLIVKNEGVPAGMETALTYFGTPLSSDNAKCVVLGTWSLGNVASLTGTTGYYPDQISYVADMSKCLDITESTRSAATLSATVSQAVYNGQGKFVPALIGKKTFAGGTQTVYIPMTNTENWIGSSNWWGFDYNNPTISTGVTSVDYTLDKFDNYAIVDGAYLTEEEKANSLGVYDKWGENFTTSTGGTSTWYKVEADWTKIHPGFALIAPTGNLSSSGSGENGFCAAIRFASITSAVKEYTEPALAAPTTVTCTAVDTSIAVTWTAPEVGGNYVAAESYEVYVDGAKVGETTDTTYTISDLASGKAYQIKIVAKSGNLRKESEAVECYIAGAAILDGIYAKFVSDTEIGIKWNEVEGAQSYTVVRNGDTEKAETVTAAEYTDFNLAPDTEYTYTVSGVGSGNAVTTYEISVTTDENCGTKEFVLYKNNKTSELFSIGSHSSGNVFEITDSTDKALTGNAKNITIGAYGAGSISFQKGNTEYNRTSSDKDGLFMYVKIPADIANGLVISFPDVSGSVHYPYGGDNKYVGSFKIENIKATDGYVPVFLPFSDPAHVNTGIKAVGFTAVGTKGTIYVDDMKFIESTPVVEKVFYRNADGKIADGLVPADISEIVVKFNTPMEESTLEAITVKTGDKTATYSGTYNPAEMTWIMKPVRPLESGSLYTVNVPTSVRAIDKYGKTTGVWKENAVTFDIGEKVTGEALAAPYNATFNTEASKLQVTMDIDKASGKVDVEITNLTGDLTKTAVTYFAAYELTGGVYKMLAAVKSDVKVLSENVTTYSVVPEAPQTFINADFVKAMTWEGNNSMIPLCSAVTAE